MTFTATSWPPATGDGCCTIAGGSHHGTTLTSASQAARLRAWLL